MKLLPLVLATVAIAFFTGSDSLFYLTYAMAGFWILSRLWTRRGLDALVVRRRMTPRAFHGEMTPVELVITNGSHLPIPWAQLHESIPIALHSPNFVRHVASLGPRERTVIRYELRGARRGLYRVGPLQIRIGDLLGVVPDRSREIQAIPFIVYPRVIPLRKLGIPSLLPFGSIASRRQIFQDPSRFFGVREYMPGDSHRQIDWKATARTERFQVKRFEPAIALHTVIFLDLNADAYRVSARGTASETAVVIAASLAAHLVEQRQQVGLMISGADQATETCGVHRIPEGHGRDHLMRLLEALAGAELASTDALPALLARQVAHLEWGSTVLIIVPGDQPGLVPVLLQLKRQGLNAAVIATDPAVPFAPLEAELRQLGIPGHWVTQDHEMDIWR